MDIAKYIGLFLLKSNFCYIPGLGNLELKKRTATYDGQALQAPVYEVVLTPGGSIDDSLANFIATNEKISIASASNAIRNFVTQTKVELQAGNSVPIPSLGAFVEINGRIQFVTDPAFKYTPPAIPTVKHATRSTLDKEPASTYTSTTKAYRSSTSGGISWGKVIIVLVIIGVVAALVAGGIHYFYSNQEMQPVKDTAQVIVQPAPEPTPAVDTTHKQDSIAAADTAHAQATAPIATNGSETIKVIVGTYTSRDKADKRTHKLQTFGNAVETIAKDSTTFYVVMSLTTTEANKQNALDSLKRTYNPKGVTEYK